MSLDQAKLLFALLALMTNAFVVGMVVLWAGAGFSRTLAAYRDRAVQALAGSAVPLAFYIAGTATFGSLYLSEVAGLEPCRLCWFQRVAMYPLMAIFAVAWLRKDRSGWVYGMPMAVVGAGLALWHLTIQWFPSLEGTTCEIGVPCSSPYFEVFGFMSIPYMALSGFLGIIVLMAVMRTNAASVAETTPG